MRPSQLSDQYYQVKINQIVPLQIDPNSQNLLLKNAKEESKYNPDAIPPDFEIAEQHKKASIIGKNDEQIQNQVCVCCSQSLNKIQLPICCSVNQLAYLGPGYPLYYGFLKFCTVITITILLSSGGFNIYTNFQYGDTCSTAQQQSQSSTCVKNWITMFSVGNKSHQNDLISIQNILNLATVVVLIIIFQIFRLFIRKTDSQCDQLDVSSADYTLLVKNIPLVYEAVNDDYDDDLRTFFQQNVCGNKKQIEIIKINLTYDLTELMVLEDEKRNIIKQKQSAVNHRYETGFYKPDLNAIDLNEQLYQIQNKIDPILQRFYDGKGKEFMQKYFTGWAFITLKNSNEKSEIVHLYNTQQGCCKKNPTLIYKGNKLEIVNPPAPSDVFWMNLHLNNQFKKQIFGWEGQKTQSDYNSSAIKKIAFAQFCVSVLLIFCNQLFLIEKDKDHFLKVFGEGGLLYNIQYVFVLNTFIPCFIEIMNIDGIIKSFQRNRVLKKQKDTGRCFLTQEQLNDLYTNPEFNCISRYTNILKNMYLMAFYSPILPMGILWTMASLILIYWADKYNFLRRRSIKYSMGVELPIEMTEMLEFILIIYCAGNLLFTDYILARNELSITNFNSYVSYIAVGLGILNAALPMQYINSKLFKVNEAPPNLESYDQIEDKLQKDYDRENPATSLKANQNHQNDLKHQKDTQKDSNQQTMVMKNI